MKAAFLGLVLSLASLMSRAEPAAGADAASAKSYGGATPLEWSQRLADSEVARLGDSLEWHPGGKAKWDYAAGLFTLSLLDLDGALKSQAGAANKYQAFVERTTGSFVTKDGGIEGYRPAEYQLDALNAGKTLLRLWDLTQEPRYRAACKLLIAQLSGQPRTADGGFWHKERYTNQMWLDGIYMATPFYTGYGRRFDSPTEFAEAVRQIRLIDEHTYDAATGLNFHGWDAHHDQPWANPVTGCSSNFWGRAEGWYAMALVDVLDDLPADMAERPVIMALLQKTARGILRWQDPDTGLWWQVMNEGERPGNYQEATASAMFVYALAKGINHGYLPAEELPAVEKGYAGIIKHLIQADGAGRWSLTHCCQVAGLGGSPSNGKARDGSFAYYLSEPVVTNDFKGLGPFIMAGIELNRCEMGSPAAH